jgi:hypothetical protein
MKAVALKTTTLYHNIVVWKRSQSKQLYLLNQVYPYIPILKKSKKNILVNFCQF